MTNTQPLITLLFPLYKSKRFLDNLTAHFDQIDNPSFNIIVSDRHCFDDTIQILQERYKEDKRFTFVAATDGIGWVEHFNYLITQVTGKYFSFVFHDDQYMRHYFDVLTEELEQKPSANMAFGRMHAKGDFPWRDDYSIFQKNYAYPFTSTQYLQLLYSSIIGIAFRGIYRTAPIHKENLLIKSNDRVTMYQDYYWIFGLMLRGNFIYTERAHCTKNFRNDGASGHWQYEQFFRRNKDACKILHEYIFSSPLPFTTKFQIYSGIEMRRWKVKMSKMMKKVKS